MIILPYHNYYPHQWDFFKACVFGDKRFCYLMWCRRAGKDNCFINGLSLKIMERPGLYVYILPFYEQVRKTVWDNIGEDGKRFIEYFPNDIIYRRRDNDMSIFFKNGSILKFVGSDNYESLRGWNPVGIVQAEYQDHKSHANSDLLPIILKNNGFMWKNGVHPQTRNHAFKLWEQIQNEEEWYSSVVEWETVKNDRNEILYPLKARQMAVVSMKAEEIDTNFRMCLPAQSERYIYSGVMNKIRKNGHILSFLPDNRIPISTYWDLGTSSVYATMAVWLIQKWPDCYRAIGFVTGCGKGVKDYIEQIMVFCARYSLRLNCHYCPHDGQNNKDYFDGKNLIQKAQEQGIQFQCPISVKSVKSGIDNVLEILPRVIFHEKFCEKGIEALENYQRKYNKDLNIYGAPLHDEFSHGADSFRYFAQIASKDDPYPKTDIDKMMGWKYASSQGNPKFRSNLSEGSEKYL